MSTGLAHLKHWRFEIDFEKIAWAVFDQAGQSMNTLGQDTVRELEAIVTAVEEAAKRAEARGLIFMSAKDKSFIAGADIREFETLTQESDVQSVVSAVTGIFDRVEKLSIPAVAAIHGFCLGGGLEFAMACHWRIADREEGTRLGLPEVKLGIIPGLHGTVRMLKLAGPLNAMPAMLAGRMLRPSAARAMGIVDQLVATHHELRWAARKAVLQKRRSKGAPLLQRLMTKSPVRGILAERMRKETAAKVRQDHYPAPFKLIELFENYGDDPIRMRAAETRTFTPLMVSETSRNLRRVFRLSEMLKSQAPKTGFEPLRVHVIGAGAMGGDIAAWCVISGMEVSLQDQTKEQVDKALQRAKDMFKKRLKGKRDSAIAMARLIADAEGRHVPRADVVIEAIFENLEAKQKLFQSLEPRLKEGAVLATNTSSLRIEDIAQALQDPGRLTGLHFFNPVAQMPLVEVVQGAETREAEVKKGCAFVTAIGKFPLIVKSTPGFLVNRVLAPYMFDAMRRYQEGVQKEKIDAAALKFGMPMGPIELADVVGLDVCKHVSEILNMQAPEDSELARLVSEGKLGKKSGEGFYKWEGGKAQKEDAKFDERELEQLGRDLIKPLVHECGKCLQERIVQSADHVDAGVIFGSGFAPFRGGPLHYKAQLEKPSQPGAAAAA